MIGFIEVDIHYIRKAYNYIKNDESFEKGHEKTLLEKISNINDIINTDYGKSSPSIFAKKEKLKIKNMLEELVYSSFLSSSDHIILRIEMASIIQDIIYMYEKKPDVISDEIDNDEK